MDEILFSFAVNIQMLLTNTLTELVLDTLSGRTPRKSWWRAYFYRCSLSETGCFNLYVQGILSSLKWFLFFSSAKLHYCAEERGKNVTNSFVSGIVSCKEISASAETGRESDEEADHQARMRRNVLGASETDGTESSPLGKDCGAGPMFRSKWRGLDCFLCL